MAAVGAFDQEGVVTGAAIKGVAASTADDHVIARGADHGIVARAGVDVGNVAEVGSAQVEDVAGSGTGHHVDAGPTVDALDTVARAETVHADRIVACTSENGVVAFPTREAVVAAVGAFDQEGVVTGAAIQCVTPGAADEEIVSGGAQEYVITGTAIYVVRCLRAEQLIGRARADDFIENLRFRSGKGVTSHRVVVRIITACGRHSRRNVELCDGLRVEQRDERILGSRSQKLGLPSFHKSRQIEHLDPIGSNELNVLDPRVLDELLVPIVPAP